MYITIIKKPAFHCLHNPTHPVSHDVEQHVEKYLQNITSWHISHFNPQTHTCRKTIVKWGHNHESFSVFQKQSPAHFQQEAIYCDNDEPLFKLEIPLTMGARTYFHIVLQLT